MSSKNSSSTRKLKLHSKNKFDLQKKLTIILFLLVPLALLIIFTYIPLVDMFKYSTYRWNGYSAPKFIGINNYKEIFKNPKYFLILRNSIYYFIGSIVQMILALLFATIFFYRVKLNNAFKGTLFFPYLLNGVAISFVFLYVFQPDGVLDSILMKLGVAEESLPLWLGDPRIVNISLTFVSVWRYMGQNMVIFGGAMESIGSEYFEAAEIDGANKWQQFKYLIFPSIRGVISLNLILAVKGAISVYEIPFIMTNGSGGSMTFLISTLNTAFVDKKIGLASAMGVVLLILILIVTFIQKAFEKRRAY